MPLKVNEIFHSIQGESIYAGLPCVFIRLTGCNLRCAYCDTAYAYDSGDEMALKDILSHVNSFNCAFVEVTGGEPLLQANTPRLIKNLLEDGYRVLMETNGTLDISKVDRRCIKIMDVKCPSSGESDKNDFKNLKRLNGSDQIKFVIGSKEDYEFARDIVRSKRIFIPDEQILFSAVYETINPADLSAWILQDKLSVRLQVQLHKILWPDKDRGV